MTDAKIRENRLRRAAARQGYRLMKSRRRDPRATDFNSWWISDLDTSAIVLGDRRAGVSLDQVEAWLERE